MGVTYKLKDDIVTFVLARKKDDPALSCRQLAHLASEKFQITVSKSSVNSILKESHLSSPIGRRTEIKSPKFEIPPEKKQQIAENLKRVGVHVDLIQKIETPLAIVQQPLVDQKSKEEESQESIIPEAQEPPQEKEEEMQPAVRHVVALAAQRVVSGGMGFAVLKAAQWETVEPRVFEELFKKYLSSSLPPHCAALCEMLLFLKMAGLSTDNIKDDERDILKIFHENFQDSWIQNVSRLAQEEVSENFLFNYFLEKERMFLEVSGFHFLLEDKTQFFIDSQGASVWDFKMTRITTPLEKALSQLSQLFIGNCRTPFFMINAPTALVSQGVKNFVAWCENIPEKSVQVVSVLDKNGEEIARFSSLPRMRRNYAINVWPAQNEFEELTKAAQWSAKKSVEGLSFKQKIFYTETKTNFINKQWNASFSESRIFTLYDEQSRPLAAVLTNDDHTKAEDVIRAYFSRWPNLDQSPFLKFDPTAPEKKEEPVILASAPSSSGGGAPGKYFHELLQDLGETVLRYSLKFFESPELKDKPADFAAILKDIPGSVEKDDQKMLVLWDIASHPRREWLEFGARSVSERSITDPKGRKFLLQAQ